MQPFKSWRDLWDLLRGRKRSTFGALVLALLGIAWWGLSQWRLLDWLLAKAASPWARWLFENAACLTALVALLILILVIVVRRPQRDLCDTWRERWRTRKFTSAGLNWQVVERGMEGEKATAVVRVTAVSELPMPLEVRVTCVPRHHSAGHKFFPDGPTHPELAGANFRHFSELGRTTAVVLTSPKLHPPACLDLRIRSVGNAAIEVLKVRRNPK